MFRDVPISADVCDACLARPISELKAFLDAEMGRKGLKTVIVSQKRLPR